MLDTGKQVLWQTVKTQMIRRHLIRVHTVCYRRTENTIDIKFGWQSLQFKNEPFQGQKNTILHLVWLAIPLNQKRTFPYLLSTTELSILLTSCLTAIKNHVI